MQAYAVTGRRYRPDYVGLIEAKRRYLPEKKRISDEAEYRKNILALETESQGLARERLEADEKASTMSSAIGLGQLGLESHYGLKRDTKLAEILEGGGGKVEGAVVPDVSGGTVKDAWGGEYDFSGGVKGVSGAVADTSKTGFWSGLKTGASKWGPIAASSLTGGTVGAELGEKFIGGKEGRIIGGGVAAGGLGYLASGDPYTAGISMIFGGLLGGFL